MKTNIGLYQNMIAVEQQIRADIFKNKSPQNDQYWGLDKTMVILAFVSCDKHLVNFAYGRLLRNEWEICFNLFQIMCNYQYIRQSH